MSNPELRDRVEARVSPWLSRLLYPLGHYVLLPLYFGKIELEGQEHIPLSGPLIVAPTHRSRWDALMLPYAVGRWRTGRDPHFMVTSNEVEGLQGWFIRRMGGFPVDVNHPSMGSLRLSIQLLEEQKVLVIFPEGDIYRKSLGEVHPLKPGLARLALQAQAHIESASVKILPVATSYSQTYPTRGCNVRINIGQPLDVADYRDGSSKARARKITQDLEQTLKALQLEDSQPTPQPTPTP